MSNECEIRRYAAYFTGWCQAFGEHEALFSEDESIGWLYGESQIGLILPPKITRQLYRKVLGKKHKMPLISLSRDSLAIGDFQHTFSKTNDLAGLDKLMQMLASDKVVHLYLTYHFMYQRGTRIITFATEQPWPLIYKEIEPIRVHLE